LIVVDASIVAAALVDDAPHAGWALGTIASDELAAPDHLMVEVAQMIRRWRLSGDLTPNDAEAAHGQLCALDVSLRPYATVADRVWELHPNVSAYDAAYVALAEMLEAPLATLDARLARATGPGCTFLLP